MTYVIAILAAFLVLQTVVIVALLIRQKRRMCAEQALRKKDEQFHEMVNRAPMMIWAARPDASVSYLNHTCMEFTGMSYETMLDTGWLTAVHPDDLEGCVDTYTPAVAERRPFELKYRVRRADGAYRWIQDTGVPSYDANANYVGHIGCAVDITDHKLAEAVISESRAALAVNHREIQHLAGELITAHEDERKHLARELHDDLTQRLALLAIDVGQMEQIPGAPKGLRPLRENLVRLSEDVHALSYRLHPSVLDDLGLVEALRAECDRVARNGSLHVEVDACTMPPSLPNDSALCLFRIAQEALNNAARHARASEVTVHLAPEGKGFQLAVSDNGDGFDPWGPRDHASLGLASMRERVRVLEGELDIESSPRGTKVIAWVPG